MANRTEIWNELREISPVVAGINHAGVFTVPENYFNTLSDKIISRIHAGFSSEKNELQGDTVTSQFSKNMPYSVPARYFESFAENVLLRIQAEKAGSADEELEILSPFLNRLDKKNLYSVPEGFFSELAGNMNSGMQAIEFVNSELENLSPLMNSLKNKNVYETPAGYFNDFAGTVLNRIKQQPAIVISIYKKRSWLKYAVAAAVIAFIATGSFLFLNKHTSSANEDPIQQLSQVSDQDMLNYLDNQSTPAVSAEPSNNNVASIDITENDVKDLFSNVSDDELQQYVDENVPSKDLLVN
ncbi:MAG: hypothetical protein JST87_15750 [Bacteroidetes bacterium]|nr:hypothetical protein [Bacteroidota bacterium]